MPRKARTSEDFTITPSPPPRRQERLDRRRAEYRAAEIYELYNDKISPFQLACLKIIFRIEKTLKIFKIFPRIKQTARKYFLYKNFNI